MYGVTIITMVPAPRGLLSPGSAFPRAYRHDKVTPFNSGNRLETGPVKYKLSSISCTDFEINFDGNGFGETAVGGNSHGTDADN